MAEQETLSESVMEAVRSGHTIAAIKRLRAERGLGLKEAKHIIDREVDAHKLANPNANVTPESTPWPKVIVIALLACILYWYFTKSV